MGKHFMFACQAFSFSFLSSPLLSISGLLCFFFIFFAARLLVCIQSIEKSLPSVSRNENEIHLFPSELYSQFFPAAFSFHFLQLDWLLLESYLFMWYNFMFCRVCSYTIILSFLQFVCVCVHSKLVISPFWIDEAYILLGNSIDHAIRR